MLEASGKDEKLPLSYGSYEDYRNLRLKHLLCKLGAEEASEGKLTRISTSVHSSCVAHVFALL
jgi:hypothetical protein